MRDMPLPFEPEAKGGVGLLHKFCRDISHGAGGGCGGFGGFGGGDWGKLEACFGVTTGGLGAAAVVCEPTSVLETKRSPSPSSASTSTLSSSLAGGAGGGGSADTAGVATFSGNNPSQKWAQGHPQNHHLPIQETSTDNSANNNNLDLFQQMPSNLEIGSAGVVEKCGGGLEYWDADLLDPAAESPGQDQSILRLIMGDVEDPSMGLNKLLQGGSGPNPDLQFGGGGLLGVVDQGFGLPVSNPQMLLRNPTNNFLHNQMMFSSPGNNSFSLPLGQLTPQNQNPIFEDCPDEKSHVLNHPQLLINQLQSHNTPNPAFFFPFIEQQQQQLALPPPPKRHNPGVSCEQQPPTNTSSRHFPKPVQFSCPQQLHLLPYMQQQPNNNRPAMATKPKMAGDEVMIQQQAIVDQLLKAAELIETGNTILAQEILARLNHQLSPIGKPFFRAAFYFKEALKLLLMNTTTTNNSSSSASPFNLFFKIGAYKSFSEISPLIQFANFTCNQAVLESLEGLDQIRIVDFDIGYGGQWASLMQELAMRKSGCPAVKITAFASPATHDQLELSLTRENLTHFAQEINMSFDFEIINIDCLNSSSSWPLPFHVAESEAIAVNLPVSSLSATILRFIKQLSPKIVVSVDRGCDRTDLPFTHHVHQALQSHLALLESLDAVNVNPESLQKIETFLIRPGIERLITGRHGAPEKTPHWKTQLLSAGFAPVGFSNFTECQAEWLLKRTLARGFHVEKRQSSLVLYFQRKELISASAWRC
nr:GRAS transcription factor 1 [Rheum palmatum]